MVRKVYEDHKGTKAAREVRRQLDLCTSASFNLHERVVRPED